MTPRRHEQARRVPAIDRAVRRGRRVLTSGQAVTLRFPTGRSPRDAGHAARSARRSSCARSRRPRCSIRSTSSDRRGSRSTRRAPGTRSTSRRARARGRWRSRPRGAPAAAPPRPAPARPRRAAPPIEAGDDMAIERGQYDLPAASTAAPTSSGSGLLDQLTHGRPRVARDRPLPRAPVRAPLVRDRRRADPGAGARRRSTASCCRARSAWSRHRTRAPRGPTAAPRRSRTATGPGGCA